MNTNTGGVRNRRIKVLNSLKETLKRGTKPSTKGRNFQYEVMIPLTESDVNRIKREVEILEQRIK